MPDRTTITRRYRRSAYGESAAIIYSLLVTCKLNDEELQECQAVPVAITETPDPVKPVTNPFWRNKSDESQNDTTVGSPQCELHLKSGVVKLFAPLTPELLRVLIREMKGGSR